VTEVWGDLPYGITQCYLPPDTSEHNCHPCKPSNGMDSRRVHVSITNQMKCQITPKLIRTFPI